MVAEGSAAGAPGNLHRGLQLQPRLPRRCGRLGTRPSRGVPQHPRLDDTPEDNGPPSPPDFSAPCRRSAPWPTAAARGLKNELRMSWTNVPTSGLGPATLRAARPRPGGHRDHPVVASSWHTPEGNPFSRLDSRRSNSCTTVTPRHGSGCSPFQHQLRPGSCNGRSHQPIALICAIMQIGA